MQKKKRKQTFVYQTLQMMMFVVVDNDILKSSKDVKKKKTEGERDSHLLNRERIRKQKNILCCVIILCVSH